MGYEKDLARFMRKVSVTSRCWVWSGARLPRGYGRFYFDGKPRYAHRVSVVIHGGKLADSDVVMHRCDNPCCVNPEHLMVGTQIDNMRDAAAKGRTRNVTDWRGEKNPKSKISADQLAELLLEISAGARTGLLAVRFGVSRVRIQQLKRKAKGGNWDIREV